MFISKVSEETDGAAEGGAGEQVTPQDYRTASELFDLMTKNRHFDDTDDDSLSTQDLVLLYKNIDLGTRLMSDATEVTRKRPNQYVETIVHEDPESDSDISENFSAEDLHHVFKLNQERLNLFDNGSFDNILGHKLGGLEIQTSDLTTEYNRQFLFKDPFIKEQLKSANVMGSSSQFNSLFPTSLLDYICCKRLEDNYNFYMDNIIRYVQHTIEQLKRISNGDYLTDRAKEKWEEINKKDTMDNKTKVLATSTSIPLHVVCKKSGRATWDDIVHSEVDVRSLSKILEKKIVVEIPKLICGSLRLFSKRCAENFVISCKREKQKEEDKEDEARVDVVLKLERSQTGQIISNISSIMILQSAPAVQELSKPEILPITYSKPEEYTSKVNDDDGSKDNTVAVTECVTHIDDVQTELEIDVTEVFEDTKVVIEETVTEAFDDHTSNDNSYLETNDYPYSDAECVPYDVSSNQYSSESSCIALRDIMDKPGLFQSRNEATFNLVSPDELRVTMQRLNMQSALQEESGEDVSLSVSTNKKSPVRVRIKSPYENQSYLLEEKKRKRLLEIREKREKKKIALSENCKVSKHKYAKSAITPQASSSVTKLSITNKSFYNSIYGDVVNDNKAKTKSRRDSKNNFFLEVPIDEIQEEHFEFPNLTPGKNGNKYINRSYYLDDAETAMTYMQSTQNENNDSKNICSASTSAVSNEFSANLTLLSQLIGTSDTDFSKDYALATDERDEGMDHDVYNNSKDAGCSYDILPEASVPVNSPKEIPNEMIDDIYQTEVPTPTECRKSIDKLYDLMKNLGKTSTTNIKISSSIQSRSRTNVRIVQKHDATTEGSIIQGSDSGTSLKHHLTSSNPSSFSFGKLNIDVQRSKTACTKTEAASVIPKVIISSKLQSPKFETHKLKKDRRRNSPQKTVAENPLKAISQLLHEFDNVQKTRQKSSADAKKEVIPNDPKMSRQNSFRRRSRLDQHLKEKEQEKPKLALTPRETKRNKPLTPVEFAKIPHQLMTVEEKHIDKAKKKIADIIDEAKEARGEAVRGPSKLNSRLNSLAQPKRSYVQAHSEQYHNKYGKNFIADRLQRLVTAAGPRLPPTSNPEPVPKNVAPAAKHRVKRDTTSCVSVKQPPPPPAVQPIAKPTRARRSGSCSPTRKSPGRTSPLRHAGSDAPETIKKMVAVESYVEHHYGRGSASPLPTLPAGNKSRVPLLPSDIELASTTSSPTTEEANELGKKLHYIIDSMIGPSSPLTALVEAQEPPQPCDRDELSADQLSTDQLSREQLSADQFSTHQLPADQLSREQLSADQFSTHQLPADQLSREQLSADQFSTHQLPADQLSREQLSADQFSTHQLPADQLSREQLSADQFSTHQLPADQLSREQLSADQFSTHQLPADQLSREQLSADQFSTHQLPADQLSREQRTDSDFNIDILEDTNLDTAVADKQMTDEVCETSDAAHRLQRYNSTMELEQLENALYNHLSGTFQNRLRIKNLTLTPKPSMQQMFLLQSGDTGSLLVKSTVSQKIECDADSLHDLKAVLSNSHVSWNFTQIPVQLATVGYAFPVFQSDRGALMDLKALSVSGTVVSELCGSTKKEQSDKISQCFKGGPQEPRLERAAQVHTDDITAMKAISNVMIEETSKELMEAELSKEIIEVEPHNEVLKVEIAEELVNALKLEQMLEDHEAVTNSEAANTKTIENNEHVEVTPSSDHVNYTTSLDMLVGLLNEIQKITCQKPGRDEPHCTDLETILSNAAAEEDAERDCTRDIVSITSVDKLRQESNPSVYSFYISSEGSPSIVPSNLSDHKRVFVDKEVNVNLCEKEVVNMFTDVPSLMLPLRHYGTNISNSLIGVLSEPSTANQSVVSFSDYHTLYSNTYFSSQSIKRIIEIPHVEAIDEKEMRKTDLNQKCSDPVLLPLETTVSSKKSIQTLKSYPVASMDFNSTIKIKRDILVTVYSILVFTVFAALSFPDMINLEG